MYSAPRNIEYDDQESNIVLLFAAKLFRLLSCDIRRRTCNNNEFHVFSRVRMRGGMMNFLRYYRLPILMVRTAAWTVRVQCDAPETFPGAFAIATRAVG